MCVTYIRLFECMNEHGLELAGPSRALYLNDPQEVAEEEPMSEIQLPVKWAKILSENILSLTVLILNQPEHLFPFMGVQFIIFPECPVIYQLIFRKVLHELWQDADCVSDVVYCFFIGFVIYSHI